MKLCDFVIESSQIEYKPNSLPLSIRKNEKFSIHWERPSRKQVNRFKNIFASIEESKLYAQSKLPWLHERRKPQCAKNMEIEKSKEIIKKSAKSSRLLNELIEILQDGSNLSSRVKKRSYLQKLQRDSVETQISANEFIFEDRKQHPASKQGPKIINSPILHYNYKSKTRRDIYSEETARPIPKKAVSASNQEESLPRVLCKTPKCRKDSSAALYSNQLSKYNTEI